MKLVIFGESCTGKTTLSDTIVKEGNVTVYHGKDYLKLAKNKDQALLQFEEILSSDKSIIWVISEIELMQYVPSDFIRIKMTADLGLICDRFAKRMKQNLSPAIKGMLERKHGDFDSYESDLHIHNNNINLEMLKTLFKGV